MRGIPLERTPCPVEKAYDNNCGAAVTIAEPPNKLLPDLTQGIVLSGCFFASKAVLALTCFFRNVAMRRAVLALLVPVILSNSAAADYRIRHDYGGSIERYKAKYAAIRNSGERVIIDGVCNSACTLVLGIVPLNRVCLTPRASLGFHMAYYDLTATDGVKVLSYQGTADFMSHYPETVKQWLSGHGGLTANIKTVKNGPELWAMVDPCPEEVF
jgi:hypothetical protein